MKITSKKIPSSWFLLLFFSSSLCLTASLSSLTFSHLIPRILVLNNEKEWKVSSAFITSLPFSFFPLLHFLKNVILEWENEWRERDRREELSFSLFSPFLTLWRQHTLFTFSSCPLFSLSFLLAIFSHFSFHPHHPPCLSDVSYSMRMTMRVMGMAYFAAAPPT